MKKISEFDNRQLAQHAQTMLDFYHHLEVVRRQPLHKGQKKVLRALFRDGYNEIQGQWGRSAGKTECIMAAAWLWALLNDNHLIYIIAPERSHGKKIYWTPGRIQRFGPPQYVAETRDSELIVVFKNGSKIIIDGCENVDALRGIKPNLVFYDEFQKHSKEFDVEVMEPNRISKSAALVVMGTPPKRDCYYVEYRQNLLDTIKAGDNKKLYLELPSSVNPFNDASRLAEIEAKLRRRGDEKIWLREYMAQLIFGGEGAIFPDFSRQKHVYSRSYLKKLVERDRKKLDWYTISDPGTTTCFAVLFAAINRYTSQVYIFKEIYEKDRKKNTAMQIWDRVVSMKQELCPYEERWTDYYDEAAVWFANEVWAAYGVSILPTRKRKQVVSNDETRAGESLIKDLMIADRKFFISDECENFIWEIENYVTGEDGEYPITDDHLMDTFFYLILESGFELNEVIDKEELEEREERKGQWTTFGREVEKEQRRRGEIPESASDMFDFGEDNLWQ